MIPQIDEVVSEMYPFRRHRARQRGQQVGAMYLVVREAERSFERLRERRAQEGPTVIPATLVPDQRSYARRRQLLGETESVQDARGVWADLDAGPNLAQD
jgi:predicted ABC-type ATPase